MKEGGPINPKTKQAMRIGVPAPAKTPVWHSNCDFSLDRNDTSAVQRAHTKE